MNPGAGRRAFLSRALGLAAASFVRPSHAAIEAVRFASDPFTLGVASGSPSARGVVLWTRLAPDPAAGGGMDPVDVEVLWEVARDERFADTVASGRSLARADRAHCVHVECGGLEPARGYFYRFRSGDAASPVGRTRTAPAPGRKTHLRLALASCQQYEQGWFVAHRHLAREDADLVAFVGDYIYESSWGREHVRKHGTGNPYTLAEYRDRYGLYKSDPDLRAAHAACPWILTWDDHEVENDYADDRSQTLDPKFLERRAAAYRAFFEHMPLRASARLASGDFRIHDRFEWGSLATLHVLDDRQYRSHQACPKPGRGGSTIVGPECTDRLAPELTLLGRGQERWLDEGFAASKARWNLVTQQTLFVPGGRITEAGRRFWTDGWDGYPAARERLLASLVRHRPANPVILGGDLHCNYIADVNAVPLQEDSPVVAAEICGTSITSQGFLTGSNREAVLAANPHLRYANSEHRGYVLLEVGADRLEARLRNVETVKRADAGIATAATFTVEAGRPGIVR